MVKCPRCGYDNNSSSTYCANCSYILSGSPTGKSNKGWNLKTRNKIIIVFGIFVILFLVFSIVYEYSQPGNEETLNVIEADQNVQTGTAYPYQVRITYDGSWSGRVGNPEYLQQVSGFGDDTISLDCVSWDEVYVNIGKTDYSSFNLTVQLLRDGEVVAENSTNSTTGDIVLSYQS